MESIVTAKEKPTKTRLEKLKIVKRAKNGEKYKDLAKEFGVSADAIRGWAAGKWLGDASTRNKRRSNYDDEFIARALAEVAAGEKVKDVAKKFGVDDSSVYAWRAKQKQNKNGGAVAVRVIDDGGPIVPTEIDGRGGRIKQAAVMLQLALTAAEKRIKGGSTIRDSQTAYTVLALNVLLGE